MSIIMKCAVLNINNITFFSHKGWSNSLMSMLHHLVLQKSKKKCLTYRKKRNYFNLKRGEIKILFKF